MAGGRIAALVPRPGASNPAPGHKIYPYLLRGLAIAEPNQGFASDIAYIPAYIPMAHGFLYLVAVIVLRRARDEAASRAIPSWRLSNAMDTSFCTAALDGALARYGKPKIFNAGQGCLPGLDPGIASEAFAGKLAAAGVAISMDGRGRFMANIFIERLWRSIKYEQIRANTRKCI